MERSGFVEGDHPELCPVALPSPLSTGKSMNRRTYCVYNQTRECFLSLGVTLADTWLARLTALVGKLRLGFDEGVWAVPSWGIHTLGVLFPLDLIYLDEDYRVIHVIESFPNFRIAPWRKQAASVLQLPTHTIYSSQTQPGDQLLICVAEEMGDRLGAGAPAPVTSQRTERTNFLSFTGMDDTKSEKSWLGRLLSHSSNRRSAQRHGSPPLVAYYWDGSAPAAHAIRDISSAGFFVLTGERWYPETVVMMTLQRTDELDYAPAERSISVQAKVVRSGEDGVGFGFVFADAGDSRRVREFSSTADQKAVLKFVLRFQGGQG
jgi:uncharacterized membrane protein (UPF0127 family)